MLAIALCAIAFLSSMLFGFRSIVKGIIVVMAWGYAYGILRANVLASGSHFIFDAALVGLYISQWRTFFAPLPDPRSRATRTWVIILIAWPMLLAFLPFQTPLITLVGLRGNIFFLPVILLALRLTEAQMVKLGFGLAYLNLGAFAMATAEYFLGVTRFFPYSAVTQIIYASGDVAGYRYHRIPSTFSSAHAYAGTMVATIPVLFGSWFSKGLSRFQFLLTTAGLAAALLGILMASTRQHFVVALTLIMTATLSGKVKLAYRMIWVGLLAVAAILALTNERFQRFKSLADSETVAGRVAGSVNRNFFEILVEYPMGNGLGGGGTSIPYFLQSQLRRPVHMENEYSRILLEQGIPGLGLWIAFLLWTATRSKAFVPGEWQLGRKLMWMYYCVAFATAVIGVGMLTSIPSTFLMLLFTGWITVDTRQQLMPQGVRPAGFGRVPLNRSMAALR